MNKEINTNFDIENFMFIHFKDYLTEKSKFFPKIYSRPPKNLADFPTVLFRETDNSDDTRYRSLNRMEQAYQITDTIEIYTQDMIIDGVRYSSKTIMSELKYLVFDFFEYYGATRLSCNIAEYSDYQVDRLVIVERFIQNSWNRGID